MLRYTLRQLGRPEIRMSRRSHLYFPVGRDGASEDSPLECQSPRRRLLVLRNFPRLLVKIDETGCLEDARGYNRTFTQYRRNRAYHMCSLMECSRKPKRWRKSAKTLQGRNLGDFGENSPMAIANNPAQGILGNETERSTKLVSAGRLGGRRGQLRFALETPASPESIKNSRGMGPPRLSRRLRLVLNRHFVLVESHCSMRTRVV
ncbi:hypothetical protein BJX66DRAFT_39566 [Aspergillus keveii]|uniref:Uncharacterized protein n=1 Tax=Aspergillus keveii TaxID=714993 RepID=A0ABR4FS84_9EURO